MQRTALLLGLLAPLLTPVLAPGLSPSCAAHAQGCSPAADLVVDVTPALAMPGQLVTVTLTNVSATCSYVLPTSCVFTSVHKSACDSDPLVAPACTATPQVLGPGQSAQSTWDQKDGLGAQVPDGGYTFAIQVQEPGGASIDLCPFVQVGLACSVPPNAYGSGGAGTGGKVPAISSAGDYPAIGSQLFQVVVSNAVGGAQSVLFIGFAPASIQANWGTFLIDLSLPTLSLPVPLQGNPGVEGEGLQFVPLPIPNDTLLLGFEAYFQFLVADPGSTGGISHTEGLRVVFCQ